MAPPASAMRPTAFPSLDTVDHIDDRVEVVSRPLQQRRFKYVDNAAAAPRGKTALLQDYARFIASFTGESEVCFQYSLRDNLKARSRQEIVEAELSDESGANGERKSTVGCTLDIKPYSEADEPFGFGFEFLADPEKMDSLDVPPALDCPFIVQYHATQLTIVVHYAVNRMDEGFFSVAFEALVNQLSRTPVVSTTGTQLSVLNHPPQPRPPPCLYGNYAGGSPSSLHSGFQRTAALHPKRIAIDFCSGASEPSPRHTLSYAELDSLTSALAVKLRCHVQGTKTTTTSHVIIPAYMAASPALYVSWLAVLKAGYAFCPLPIDAPPEQLHGIIEEVGASLVLCNGLPVGGRPWDARYCDDDELATCLDVSDFILRYREGSHSPPPVVDALPEIAESDLAYVMYTSGSTGKPKGVRIHHLAAACSIASHAKFIPASYLKDGFRWFQFAAPTFDPSIMEIFTTWWTGGTLCGAPRELLLTDPEGAVNRLSATIMMATPSMASALRPERVPTLRHLWTMGEKLTPKVIRNFSSDSPLYALEEASHTPRLQRPRRLLNAYGPTEGAINCNIVSDFSAHERGSIIGKPIDTCSILIIDAKSRRPVPIPLGFSGELAIGGPQVSQGYLNRPEETAAAFVSSSEYGRLYRTGDRARVVKNKQGELTVEFLGRITTDQVKLSGRRVELGQIESAIAAVSGVIDVVTIVHSHGSAGHGSEQIVACVVGDNSIAKEELTASCQRAAEVSLAPFMRPATYIFLDSMPRSRSGKTDRKALQAIADHHWNDTVKAATEVQQVDGTSNGHDPTLTIIVEALAEICDVKAGSIAPGTDLLSIGLDSLRAVRFLQSLRDQGITDLTIASVLSSRTPSGIARYCTNGSDAEKDAAQSRLTALDARLAEFNRIHLEACAQQLALRPADIESVLPTTATQSGMIASFYRSVSKATTSGVRKRYINHSIYHEAPGTDSAKLEDAWRSALTRPKILRTVFTPVDDEISPFAQCVLSASSGAAAFSIHRYSCTSPDAWERTVRVAQQEAEASISLDRSPFRLALIQSSTSTAYLLSLFHGVFDGGSLELILQDVEASYLDRPPLPRTEMDGAVRKHFSEATEASVTYWQTEFKDFEPVPFPCVSASKPETQSPDALVSELMGNITLERLSAASKAASVSPLSILQAAWASVLLAYTGTTSAVSFGSVLSNRLDHALSTCHGPTFVVVPVKLSHSYVAQNTARAVLAELTRKNAEALPYHHIPLSSLVTAEGTLPYDTLLAFQAFDKSAGENALWQKVDFPEMEHDFAIMVEVWPTSSGALRLRATFTHRHLDRTAAGTMLQQLDHIVSNICDNMDAAFLDSSTSLGRELLSEFPLVEEEEAPASELLLHHAFEQNVLRTPDKIALTFRRSLDRPADDIKWTYAQLSALAHSFATRLVREFGPVENEPIMICMEKCPELYVAVLGVLKAGAGWCPIDPYSPSARQHAIMESTGSRIVLLSTASSTVQDAAIPEGVSTLTIDLPTMEAGIETELPQALNVTRDPSHLAYLIFTSGTTGLPKGVPITHGAGATAMNAVAQAVPSDTTTGEVRCMQFSQYTFDVFVQDLFYTWTLGGMLISSTRQIMLQNFTDIANDLEATHAHLTPAFAATLARSGITTLEVVTMIGEKLTEAVAADWGSNMRAFNTYGPAEVTVVSTLRQFTGRTDTYHSSNIGIPLPSVGAYVVHDGKVVMRGGMGELALAGPQLSPGYCRLAEVNARKFVWLEQLQQTVYLTGDMVRHLADGTLNYIGRDDDLVKLGGQRVELGEIAFALREADARIEKFEVLWCKRKDADTKAVVAFLACPSITGHDGPEDLTALLTPVAKEVADVAKEYARAVLPPHMIPSSFIVLPRIPRTASAKVDRAQLTSIYHSVDLSTWATAEDTAAATGGKSRDLIWREDHHRLLQVISHVLAVPPEAMRPSSSLPEIGLDSIATIRLIPKINALGYGLSVIDAFKCRSLRDLCELADMSVRADSPQALEASAVLQQLPDDILQSFDARYYRGVVQRLHQDEFTVIPTTILQESLLAESLKDPQAYWSSHLFRLDDDVDVGRLRRAWTKVTRQTEALRAGFLPKAEVMDDSHAVGEDGLSYLQIIYDEPQLDWNVHEISRGDMQNVVQQRVADTAQRNYERLFQLPPWAIDIFVNNGERMMLLTISHVIYDGSSLDFLEEDVKAAYLRSSRTIARLPWRDAIATRSALDADSDETLRFWKTSLHDFDASSAQGLAENRKLHHRVLYRQSSTSMGHMRKVAVDLGLSSIVTIFRTAWALVLTDLLESPHVVFAEVVSDRVMDSKLMDVVGPLVSTVPVLFRRKSVAAETMVELDGFSKAAGGYRNIRPNTLKALLGREARAQVYPAVFVFHPAAGDKDRGGFAGEENKGDKHLLWRRLDDVTNIEVEHPFALNVWQDTDTAFRFELGIADHIMNESEQFLLLEQLDALVAALVDCPHSAVASLTDSFPDRLLSRTTPRRDTKCPSDKSPAFYVEHWADTHPEWKAVEIVTGLDIDGTETEAWTYAELNAAANRIAHFILEHGVTKQMIGMCIGRTLMSFAIPLGILKSGNTYLPIDEALPAERKAFLLHDSGAAFLFATQTLSEGVEIPQACKFVDVDDQAFERSLAAHSAGNLPRHGGPRDNAYLLYTSGSTGKPKGVLVNQENLASFAEAHSEFICDVSPTRELAGRGKYLGLASRAFDVHIGEMFLAWTHGFALTTGLKSMFLDDLALCLTSLHITHASFVPSLLDQTGLDPEHAPELVYLAVGGEKMSLKTKKKWEAVERVGLINAYGPTEATIGCTAGRIYPDSDMRDIGAPLGDSLGHVLVPGTDHYALRGMPGELCFTGSLIANGYFNRPDAKGFVEDFHGQRMYRTGDIVKLRTDDHIIFLGRKDDQVKIRGQRVELGEVAEGVREASDQPIDTAALVIQHPELSRQQLVAFAARAGASKRKGADTPPAVDISRIQEANTTFRHHCQKSLPVFMVPDVIVPLDYIPLAPTSGKADNRLLVKIFSETPMSTFATGRQQAGAGVAVAVAVAVDRPMTDGERQVWDIIAPVLKDKPSRVSPISTMFELGIDSLSAISVFSALRKAGYQCSVAMVMKNPTIEALAQTSKLPTAEDARKIRQVRDELARVERELWGSDKLSVRPRDISAIRPCLPLQEVLVGQSMHHHDADGEDGAYVNHIVFKIGADIDVARLRRGWESVTGDNEILRTCFTASDDAFYQVVLTTEANRLHWGERLFSADTSLECIQKQVAHDILRNIRTQPPLRINHLREHGELLMVSIHHAIYDGHSVDMMLRDVQSVYRGQTPDMRLSSQPLVEHIAGQDHQRAQEHWTTLLSQWETAPLLIEAGAKNITLTEAERRFSANVSRLERQTTGLNITLTTVLQAAFAIALCQTLHTSDFIFGNVLSGRTIAVEHAESIMAPCIATIPARVGFPDVQQPLREVLARLQQDNSASLEFQHVSPRAIQRWTKADRPLYDCLFSFTRIQARGHEPPPLLEATGSNIAVDYALAIEFEANAVTDELTVRVGFTEAFGSLADANVLLERIEMLVEAVCERSDLTIAALGVTDSGTLRNKAAVATYDEANWSPLEHDIRVLLSEYTGAPAEDIRKDTAFIHLGIDSISAIRFAKCLRNKGFRVSSADVIRYNRLGSLAEFLAESGGRANTNGAMNGDAGGGEHVDGRHDDDGMSEESIQAAVAAQGVHGLGNDVECYACTPLVAGMLTQSWATDGAFYMHHHAFRCHADVDIGRLREAWNAVVADLDVLRTTFHWLPDSIAPWVAVVHQDKKAEWHEIEVADAREHWLSLSAASSDFPARIDHCQPLAKAQLVRSPHEPVVILTLHHAIYDGLSIGMLFRQLAMRYLGVETPPLTPFYEAARAIAQVAKPAVKFWLGQVKGYEGAPIPKDEGGRSFTLAQRTITTDDSLELQCRRADVDIKDVCVAAFGKAVACLHGRRDVVFGHVMAARTLEVGGGDDIVGPMFNTVPFRVSLRDSLATNRDVVRAVHDVHTGSLEYQHASLADIQKAWRESAVDPRAPLIDSLFVYYKVDGGDGPGLLTLGQPLETDQSPVPSEYRLNFEVEHTPGGITARALSSIPTRELDTLLDHFQGAMHEILDQPERYATAFPDQLRTLPVHLKSTAPQTEDFDPSAIAQYAETIRNAMADVAQVPADQIALHSSIYAFGIDSIAGIQIAARCRKAGLRVSVADILKGGMLGRICEIVAAKAGDSTVVNGKLVKGEVVNGEAVLVGPDQEQAALDLLQRRREDVEEVLPVLAGQEYHLLSWLQSGRTLYEPGWSYRASTKLDARRLQRAWRKLRQRNAVLRTTFAATGPRDVVQVVLRDAAVTDDAFHVCESDQSLAESVKERGRVEAHSPSDFFTLPVRLRLVRAPDGDAVMFYVHHALYDAWSMPRLVTELAAIYREEEPDSAPSFAELVRHTIRSIDADEERQFWRESLSAGQRAILPSTSAPTHDHDRRQTFHLIESTTALVSDLERICSRHHISPTHVVLLAFARALAHATQTSSPLFGFFQLGRSAAFDAIERVTGPMVNSLPMTIASVRDRGVRDVVVSLPQLLAARVPFEQSSLRSVVRAAFGPDTAAPTPTAPAPAPATATAPATTQLPFNASINLLWNKAALTGSSTTTEHNGDDNDDDDDDDDDNLFHPLALGVPTDFSSPRALPGRTAIDALDTTLLPPRQLFVDVGPGETGIVFGVRADTALMDVRGVRELVRCIEKEVGVCLEALRA